jgi:hypothetical protein
MSAGWRSIVAPSSTATASRFSAARSVCFCTSPAGPCAICCALPPLAHGRGAQGRHETRARVRGNGYSGSVVCVVTEGSEPPATREFRVTAD